MTDYTYYIIPESSGGGDGTTRALSGANAAYPSLQAAQLAQARNLDSANDSVIFKRSGSAADTTKVVWSASWVCTSPNKVRVENDTGQTGGDPDVATWDATVSKINVTTAVANDSAMDFGTNDVRSLGLLEFSKVHIGGVFTAANYQTLIYFNQSPWGGRVLFDACVLRIAGTNTSTNVDILSVEGPVNVDVRNSVLLVEGYTGSAAVSGTYNNSAGATVRFHNCVLVGLDIGAEQAAGVVSFGNSILTGCAVDTIGTVGSVGGNRSDNSSLGSMTTTTNDAASLAFAFESAGVYRLSSGDTGAALLGVPLHANADLPVTEDAFGTTRSLTTPSSGIHEVVSLPQLTPDALAVTVVMDVASTSAETHVVTPASSSGVPGAVIAIGMSGYSEAPTAVTINTQSASTASETSTGFSLTMPALSDFVAGGTHEATQFQTNIPLVVTETAGSGTAYIQVDEPVGSYYGTVVEPLSGSTVFPGGTVAGDLYLVEDIGGTLTVVNPDGSIGASSGLISIRVRIFDVSTGLWTTPVSIVYGERPDNMAVGVAFDLATVYTSSSLFPASEDVAVTLDGATTTDTSLAPDSVSVTSVIDVTASTDVNEFEPIAVSVLVVMDVASTSYNAVLIDLDTDRIRIRG